MVGCLKQCIESSFRDAPGITDRHACHLSSEPKEGAKLPRAPLTPDVTHWFLFVKESEKSIFQASVTWSYFGHFFKSYALVEHLEDSCNKERIFGKA
jgi:hypothetical protein